jgi:hypothetical protein
MIVEELLGYMRESSSGFGPGSMRNGKQENFYVRSAMRRGLRSGKELSELGSCRITGKRRKRNEGTGIA